MKDATEKLDNIQNQLIMDGNDEILRAQETTTHNELDKVLAKEEMFWFEKSIFKWHLEGDRNTIFFTKHLKLGTTKILSLFL